MIPFKKILAAVQVDSDSTQVVDLAGALATWNQAELDLIHVFETPGYEGPRELTWQDGQVRCETGELAPWRSAQAMARMLERWGPWACPPCGEAWSMGSWRTRWWNGSTTRVPGCSSSAATVIPCWKA